MPTPKLNTTDVRPYVRAYKEFDAGKNPHSQTGYAISGRHYAHLYVVFSYGYWPMYVCDMRTGLWFANEGKASVTTTRHQSHARPVSVGSDMAWLPTHELDKMIDEAARRAA